MATLHKFHVGDGSQPVSLQSINKYVIGYTTASGGYYYITSGTPSNYILKYFTTTADMRSKQMIINIDNTAVAFYQANSTAQDTRPTLISSSSYTYEQTATGYKYTLPANTLTDTYLFVVTYIATNTYSSYWVPDTAQILGDLTEWRDGTLDECNSNIWSGTGTLHEYSASQTLEVGTYSYDTGVALRYSSSTYSSGYSIQGVNGAGSVRYLVIPPGVTTFTTTNAPIAMYPTSIVPTMGVSSSGQLTPTSTDGNNRTYTITASASTQYIILLDGITQSYASYCANNRVGTGVSKAFWT